MTYNIVSSQMVIAKIYNDFNIDYAGWRNRSIEWIGDCLRELNIYLTLEPFTLESEVIDFKTKLPCDIKTLRAIEYDGYRLPPTGAIARQSLNANSTSGSLASTIRDYSEIDELVNNISTISQYAKNLIQTIYNDNHRVIPGDVSTTDDYNLTNNGWVHFSFETGTVYFHYLRFPIDCDGYPMIPDNQKLIKCLEWYIMTMICARGHKHPVFNFSDCEKRWLDYAPKAKNSVMAPNSDIRNTWRRLWTSMLINPNAHNEGQFI